MNALDAKFDQVASWSTDMQGHMAAIKGYASQCPSATEFGVYDCTSTWALLAGRPTRITSYDISRREEVMEVEEMARASGIAFQFVLANTVEIEIEETDLLFIDSYHNYGHLKKELEMHAPKVRKFILLHDTTTFEFKDEDYKGKGLWPAISEFLASNPQWTIKERFTHCHGLTVLARA